MIQKCSKKDFDRLYSVINDAAQAYKGKIPSDCWHEPYMTAEYLTKEIDRGVDFFSYKEKGDFSGVMGIQHVGDVTLIRHAYVLTAFQRKGIGGRLLAFLVKRTDRPVLIGTWKAASWAISFYQKHSFTLVNEETKNRLLRKYWVISDRQVETSVILADAKWLSESNAS